MNSVTDELNNQLVKVYHNVLRLEETTLKGKNRINISINEMHLIDCIGKADKNGITVSELACLMNVTKPSITVAVNKLERNKYLIKTPSETDGRFVKITLTREGQKILNYHRYYHRNMVKRIANDCTEQEIELLLRTLNKLNEFFMESIGEK